jgi:hypothetical protein
MGSTILATLYFKAGVLRGYIGSIGHPKIYPWWFYIDCMLCHSGPDVGDDGVKSYAPSSVRLYDGHGGIEIATLNQTPAYLVPSSVSVPTFFLKRSLMRRVRR